MSDANDMPVDVSAIAEKWSIPYPVKITESLNKALMPNDFLADLGIQFSERLYNILGVVKGNLIPRNGGPVETIPKDGTPIPYAITQGPFIREIPILVRAELKKNDTGESEILLSIIQDEV
ncbi:hypothetical protein AGMMS49991_11570 [Spirochaetia bacterium]|nr:hypothetical protein AGMMS49991_11570 [Spirochaetia bacterium]